MALDEYNRKRRFDETPEPKGKKSKAPAKTLRFVVHKHAATRLHYDLRLEIDGTYKSWAVPKGPSLNPADKRLAMMVEDHPIEYGKFEGIIPKGNYGAGTVMIWDEGELTSDPEGSSVEESERRLREGLEKGDMKFKLTGAKLHGSFVLAKMKSADQDNAWLLIKHRDDWTMEEDITELDKSVATGRSLEEIAESNDQWLSKPEVEVDDTPKAKQPDTIKPMLATATDTPFNDPKWLYEIKWDGYRILAHVKNGEVTLKSRNNQDYTNIFALVAEELAQLHIDCILDGEMVVLDDDGRSSFGALQNYQKTGKGNLAYYVFDVIHADGHDLRKQMLEQRKDLAFEIIKNLKQVRFSDHAWEKGEEFFALATEQKLEGIVAKDSTSTYEAGKRSKSWLKLKTQQRQEAVIAGYTEPKGSRRHFGSLILGVYDDKGQLQPVGSTGGGFDQKELKRVHDLLKKIENEDCPFATKPKTLGKPVWVEPKYVCEVAFSEWTDDKQMRHPIYLGMRDDKDPKEVVFEMSAKPASKPKKPSHKTSGNVEITNRDKIFFPDDGITKGDIVDYYDSIAEIILPYLKDRPESLNRHPNGINGKSFYQKDLEKHPDWVRTEPIFSEHNSKDINWLIANDRDHLLYMANLGSIELHPWHSRLGNLDNPDYCLIDLDAKDATFDTVIKVAQETHKLLDELGVPSFPKTSGKTGLHILIPLGAKYDYEQSKMFAQLITGMIHSRIPNLTSIERTPAKRKKGTIYLDYLQNRKGQTMAAPYCVRPVPGAPVSTPLEWSEVKKGLDPKKFTIKTTQKRIDNKGDLLSGVLDSGIDLAAILNTLES